jgi:hypothetical protein
MLRLDPGGPKPAEPFAPCVNRALQVPEEKSKDGLYVRKGTRPQLYLGTQQVRSLCGRPWRGTAFCPAACPARTASTLTLRLALSAPPPGHPE